MYTNMNCPASDQEANSGDVAVDLYPFLRKYKDGHFERFLTSSFVPASEDTSNCRPVATRDVIIDAGNGVSARLFLPFRRAVTAAAAGRRLPLVVYFHGGSFCAESAFCRTYHRYVASLASRSGALVVSVEYRLAPEHPIPAPYDDAWAALRWAASLSDPWLAAYADSRHTFLAGDSAGGNIAYHMAVRASHGPRSDGMDIDINGLVMVQPYFWGAERLPSEMAWEDGDSMFCPVRVDRLWPFVTAGEAGNEDPRIDPPDEEIVSLSCRRVLVAVAEKDTLRDRGLRLAARMHSGGRSVTVVESEEEDHGFHIYSPLRGTSKKLMESIVHFIHNSAPLASRWPATVLSELHDFKADSAYSLLSFPTRPYKAVFLNGLEMDSQMSPRSSNKALNVLAVGPWKGSKRTTRYGWSLPARHHNLFQFRGGVPSPRMPC